MRTPQSRFVAPFILLVFAAFAGAEEIRIATYNVEHFAEHFEGRKLAKAAATQPKNDELKELIGLERKHNDEDNWEVAQVIQDKNFDPDIIVIEECCDQKDLDYFNKRWLHSEYETVIVFPGNSGRDQFVGMMTKPGFKVVERKDQYYLENDTVSNERGSRLFARGPAFCLIQSPGGSKFWVGVTHQKSKSDNSVRVTEWRNREAKRTHEIMREIESKGPPEVILLGDMNDELGLQDFEDKAGGDSIAFLVGPPEHGFTLATQPLIDAKRISFGGYFMPRYRSFIDHIIVSKKMKPHVEEVKVFQAPLARVASDHYPVYVQIEIGDKTTTRPTTKPTGDEVHSVETEPAETPAPD